MKASRTRILLVFTLVLTNLIYAQKQNARSNTYPLQLKSQPKTKTEPIAPIATANEKHSLDYLTFEKGSFYLNLKGNKVRETAVFEKLKQELDLSENHTFKIDNSKTDDLNIMHKLFHQYYKGIKVEDGHLMVHSKNGELSSINGRIATFNELKLDFKVSPEIAVSNAMAHLKVSKLITTYPTAKVIIANFNKVENAVLAYKIRIDSEHPLIMVNTYINTMNGEIVTTENLIADADVPGTGQSLYNGKRNITCDSHSGGYRLRESSRKIETYNATSAGSLTTSGFTGSTDFTNSTVDFQGLPTLNDFSVSTVSQGWWYSSFSDKTPDLYIKVIDGNNKVVLKTSYINNKLPPVSFKNLNVILTDPPYKIELYDYDPVGGDDFGGSYSVNNTSGTKSWSGNGNNGNYKIGGAANPAIDVHWGMEVTYDYYKNVLNRNSYDGAGGLLKQYLNPPDLQANQGNTPNSAFAMGSPYYIMAYGLGDGIDMSAVVALDVAGHEFTHMVVDANGNGGLKYEGESGALNESFADIFGTCIEFYSNVNPDWTLGEDIMLKQNYMRSLVNPKSTGDPDTYEGSNWVNPTNLQNDHGGVHTNSGVQNHWFYLLSQGGSGTNDKSNSYSVTGIGITKASKIAYRNLTRYLGTNATYLDAYNGSLQAAQDLYGSTSTEYQAVRTAWYAVGIGNNPVNYCSGTTNLNAPSGVVTDGSGSTNYKNYSDCKWVIAPPGATRITLTFTEFDTEASYDTVLVYDGPNESYPVLATWWGKNLPPVIRTTSGTGAMCIRFTSDVLTTGAGWKANYTTIGTTPSCGGSDILSSPSGQLSDGSNFNDYGNNQDCYWYIAPPCANSITLSFSQFSSELNYDGVIVYDDFDQSNRLGTYTGSTIPSNVTSNTGIMLVRFISDFSTTKSGFNASYTSTGSSHCSGKTTYNTLDFGYFSDGSGTSDYCNNTDCEWLIQPPQAKNVSLRFTEFDLEDPSPDGQTVFDEVEVYDGVNSSAPLLGKFSGKSLPPVLTSTGNSLFIRFRSDLLTTGKGWDAEYTSTQQEYCSGLQSLTTKTGTLDDGSNQNDYANNSFCSWLIQPIDAKSITLSFSDFSTEQDFDGVAVYDGADASAPLLGSFTGSSLPSDLTTTGGSMYVEFQSDPSSREKGWSASYTSEIFTGIESNTETNNHGITVYPNPVSEIVNIELEDDDVLIRITDITGSISYLSQKSIRGRNIIQVDHLNSGTYILSCIGKGYEENFRIIIK